MSGTSTDGIDLALIESDGRKIINVKNFTYLPYDERFKNRLNSIINKEIKLEEIKLFENEFTQKHADLVNSFLKESQIAKEEIDLIAFHGHTILHNPLKDLTWQIGNSHLLANQTQINVISDFRSRDVALGGQGAPLVPIYHFYLFANQIKPCAILNIGGISNVTYFENEDENSIRAFDICFGNAPFDDLVKRKTGADYDLDGNLAKKGKVDLVMANNILKNDIFYKKPPKSFSRNDFEQLLLPINNLKLEDSLATLAYIHAKVLEENLKTFANFPKELIVCGGGRKNQAIMAQIREVLSVYNISIKNTEHLGLNGDSIEAEAFAFLGIRSLLNLPISLPEMTGIKKPACGGVLYLA